MATDTLDNDFRSFVRHRDPAALAAVFDAAAPRLLLVAMHLTRDSASAEDLVQTVFLQVLRDAAGFDVRRPVMPWLLGLLEHRAADARRRAHRHHERADDALLAASPASTNAPAPPDAAASAETRHRVAEALAGMPSDYRQVLTLRLVHGIAAVDIAHSLGLPPATVRTRLSRGLQLLRSALPRGLATPALLAWLGGEALRASSGLQAVRAKVLAAAGGGAVATATGLWLLAVAALLVGLGWWGWQSAGGLPQEPAITAMVVPATVERTAPGDSAAGEQPAEPGAGGEARSATRVVAADPRATQLRGVVVAAESGQPLADAQVTLFAYPNSGRLPTDWVAPEPVRTDAAGRFSLALVPPAATGFNLELMAPGRVLDDVSFESLREAVDVDVGTIALQLGTPLMLEVRRGGEPAGGIDVGIGRWRDGERPNGHLTNRSDRTGRIDLGRVQPGRFGYEVEFALQGATGDFDVPLQVTPRLQVIELHEHPRDQAITGFLVDPGGATLPAIDVGYRLTRGTILCKTDDAGRFALVRNPLSPTKVQLELPGRPELVLIAGQEDVVWGSHDVRLVARWRADSSLRLQCIDAETGAPVTCFGATCWRDPWALHKRGASAPAHYEPVAPTEHASGSVLLEGLSSGAAFVSVFPVAPYAEFAEHAIVLDEGRVHTLQVALRRPVTCTVRTIDATTGVALAGIDVVLAKVLPVADHARFQRDVHRIDLTQGRVPRTCSSGTNVLELARGLTDADGIARLVVPPDLPALVLFAEGPRCQGALRRDIVIARDGTELEIAVAAAAVVRGTVAPLAVVERFGPSQEALAELAARARIERIEARELALEYPELQLRPPGVSEPAARTRLLADGSFEVRSVPPGRYEAWLQVNVRQGRIRRGQCLGPLATVDVAIGTATEPLRLDAGRWLPGQIDLRVLLDGAPHHGKVLLHSDDAQLQFRSDASGRLRTDWLPPGTYHACLDLAEDWPHQLTLDPQPIVVTAGAVVEVVATCVRREVTIELHAAAGATLPANCWLLLRALDHPVPHLDWTGAKVDDRGVAWFRTAPPGRLRVELMTREQFAARDRDAAVPVGELAPGATSLRCTLPR